MNATEGQGLYESSGPDLLGGRHGSCGRQGFVKHAQVSIPIHRNVKQRVRPSLNQHFFKLIHDHIAVSLP